MINANEDKQHERDKKDAEELRALNETKYDLGAGYIEQPNMMHYRCKCGSMQETKKYWVDEDKTHMRCRATCTECKKTHDIDMCHNLLTEVK